MSFETLSQEIRSLFSRGIHEPLAEDHFNDLALRVFGFQTRANAAYGAFVGRRGVDPLRLRRWQEIPHLPTAAFKSAALVAGDPGSVERIFRTSGTTRGRERRGEHHVLALDLYRENLLPNFQAHLLPDGGQEMRALCLLPSPDTAPDSSLSFMMGEVVDTLGGSVSGFFVGGEGEIQVDRFRGALEDARQHGGEVLVAGTAFSFVRWIEIAEENGWPVELPPGSRIMETGGYKGRSRELPRAELYSGLERVFGIPQERVVNEYGMTELLSQFYEPVLAVWGKAGGGGRVEADLDGRAHRGPPWARTQVLDPMTLDPVPEGEVGILAHLDLANLGSVAAILTEDLGRIVPGGFKVLGRSPGSEPRGCSLAMEDFLASSGLTV